MDLFNREQQRLQHIKKLNGYGIYSGPEGENLRTWDYHELLRYLTIEEMKRDDEPLRSVWI